MYKTYGGDSYPTLAKALKAFWANPEKCRFVKAGNFIICAFAQDYVRSYAFHQFVMKYSSGNYDVVCYKGLDKLP